MNYVRKLTIQSKPSLSSEIRGPEDNKIAFLRCEMKILQVSKNYDNSVAEDICFQTKGKQQMEHFGSRVKI